MVLKLYIYPINEELGQRIRTFLKPFSKDIEEKKMFGGLCYMYKGKMSIGTNKDELMIRVVSEKYEKFLQHARGMDFTGRVLKDFLFIHPDGFKTEEQLTLWCNLGIEHAESASSQKNVKLDLDHNQ